jgi:hypothetical protein
MKRLKSIILPCVILASLLCAAALGADKAGRRAGTRSITGIVYFTNNTPEDKSFLVELFAGRAHRRVAAKWTEESGNFEFKGLKPGVYYLQVSGPQICLLQYEVDASKAQPESLQVFGDADCGRSTVAGLPAPRPVPRAKKR